MANDETIKCPAHPYPQKVMNRLYDTSTGIEHVALNCGCTLEYFEGQRLLGEDDDVLTESQVHNRSTVTIQPGDIVRWNTQLFSVRKIKYEGACTWVTVWNVHGEDEVLIDWLEYVGKDTLTMKPIQQKQSNPLYDPPKSESKKDNKYFGEGKSRDTGNSRKGQPWDSKDGYDYNYEGNNWRKKESWHDRNQKPKPQKRDSIDTASLIESEVKELKNESHADKNWWEDEFKTEGSAQERKPTGDVRPLRTKPPTVTKDESGSEPVTKLPKRRGDW